MSPKRSLTALASAALLAVVVAQAPSARAAAKDAGSAAAVPAVPATTVDRARAELTGALTSTDGPLRSEAYSALGLSRLPDAKEKLLAALEQEDGKTRFGAARGLSLLADPGTADAVSAAFRAEKGWSVKKELAAAAAATGAKGLVPELEQATLAPQPELAQAAAWALEDLKVPSPAAKAALTRLGNPERKTNKKPGVDRWSRKVLAGDKEGDLKLALRTLAEVGTAEDAPLFARHLQAQDATARVWAAAGLLRHFTGK